jgi:ketosteroid isomerase-like protein
MQALEALKTYYEALANKNLEVVADSYDVPSKMITLAGSVNFGSRDAVKAAFENLIQTWEQQGISSKIGFDEADFSITQVQENVVLIRNQLTNFDLNGNFHQTWECTYVMAKSDEKWKISLATTNNRATTSVRD